MDCISARRQGVCLVCLHCGKAKMNEAEKLYQEAAKCKPADAMERLDVELAKSELED